MTPENIYEKALSESKIWKVDPLGRIYRVGGQPIETTETYILKSRSEELRKLLEYIEDNMESLVTPYLLLLLNDEEFRIKEIKKSMGEGKNVR